MSLSGPSGQFEEEEEEELRPRPPGIAWKRAETRKWEKMAEKEKMAQAVNGEIVL